MQAAIYCRLSKEDNKYDDSESIKNQKVLLTSYALERDWDIYEYYIDDDFKGSDRDRPAFNRMIKDAKEKRFQIILCKTQARFCRDMELVEKYLHKEFPEWGIRFISIIDHSDSNDADGKKARQITGLKDEWYLEDLSRDINRVLHSKQANGQYIGSWALYGYDKDPNCHGHLIIDPPAAEVVRLIYNKYLSGMGMKQIATELNVAKIDNPYTSKIKKGMKLNEGRLTPKKTYWNIGAVYSILNNQIYCGDMVQGRFKKASYKSKKLLRVPEEAWKIKLNTHEPIIAREVFERVKTMRSSRKRPVLEGTRHIWSGHVFCMECGQIMSLHRFPKKRKDVPKEEWEYERYLACSSRATSKELCEGSSIMIKTLDRYVLNEINDLARMYFNAEEIEKKTRFEKDQAALELEHITKEENRLNNLIEGCAGTLKCLYKDRVEEIVSIADFTTIKNSIAKEQEEYKTALKFYKDKRVAISRKKDKEVDRKSIIEKYKHISELSEEIIDELVEKVYISRKNKEDGTQVIKIIWNI